MVAIEQSCKTCSYSPQGSSTYSAFLSRHNLQHVYGKKTLAGTTLRRIGDPLRADRGASAQGAICNSLSSAGALAEATSVQHPSKSFLRRQEAGNDVRHPIDLHNSLVDLAVEELEQACGIPLVAPHTFQRVAQWQYSAAQPMRSPPQSLLSESCGLHSPGQPGGVQPAADSTMMAAAGGGWRASWPDSAAAGRGVEAWQGSAASGAAKLAATPAATLPLAPSVTRLGFLVWEPSSSSNSGSSGSSWPRVPGATTAQGTTVASVGSAAATQHRGGQQQQQQAPMQLQAQAEAWSVELAGRRLDSGECSGLELGPAAAGATKQAAATACGEPRVGSGAWPLRTDPRDFPALPPHRLASLLLECAAKKVPVRLSALQSYADQVSYRASELTADELVSALDGLSRYGFRAAASPRGSASPRGLTHGNASPSAPRRSSPTCWARILSALLTEAPATGPAATVPPAATAAAGAPGARERSGATRGGGGHGRRGSGAASGRPSRSRVAALGPRRVVDLVLLLTQLGIQPPRGWVNSLLSNTSHLLPHMSGGDLTRLLKLLPVLQAAPDAAWWNVVLDTWAPRGPPPRQPSELTSAGGGSTAAAVSTNDGDCEPSAGGGLMNPAGAAADAGDVSAVASRGAHGSEWGYGDAGTGGECGVAVGCGCGGHSGAGGKEGAGQWAAEVRSAVLYCISAVGWPQGTYAAPVISRLESWAQAALYDIAREALVTGQLACAGGLDGSGGSRSVTSQSSLPVRNGTNPNATVSHDWGSGTATAARGSGGAACGVSPPLPPSARAIAQALTALPAVMPGASSWAADPAGCGRGVLAVLVASLEPRLGEVPADLLVELLQGFSRSALHPGRRFLLVHAVVLKGRTAELSPRQLLQAARHYTKLGLVPRGGLRVAIIRAREALRREALKLAARPTAGGRFQVAPGAIAVQRRQGKRHQR